jgi:hypothetical protein
MQAGPPAVIASRPDVREIIFDRRWSGRDQRYHFVLQLS